MEDHANLSRGASAAQSSFGELIGESLPMERLYGLIRRVSQNTTPILLLGETGTGKELVARCIHCKGLRRHEMFVPVDCSALSPFLMESELFGYVKGAFTGADDSKRGLLQAAHGGTILLDEIGDLPVLMQAKLLRALQQREIRPVGSTEQVPIDVRIIAATNRDLEAAVRAGTFRQDLFFRLNVVQIKVPPLRDRKIDIPILVSHFLKKFSDSQTPVHAISDEALRLLIAHDWPGNIRELQNAIESAVALSSDSTLTPDDFALLPKPSSSNPPVKDEFVPLAELERRAVLHALRETRGDKDVAARLLGIGRTTLYRKLKEYGRTGPPS